ncbi:MAG TPA: hypothetical protein DDY18_11850 [Flavobacterium sp.]|nr:hypothetical protein [Flavobacterium sp.]
MFKTYQFLQQLHTRQVITTKEFHPGYTYDTVTTEYKWMDVEIGEYTNNEFNPEEQNDTKKEDQKEEKVD